MIKDRKSAKSGPHSKNPQAPIPKSQEYREEYIGLLRVQKCPVCDRPMGDMPGMRDAVCHNCGFKDPCCE